jgi:AAA+ superfamily predicted ATPase
VASGGGGRPLEDAILIARLNEAALVIVADDADIDPGLARLTDAPVPMFVTVPADGCWAAGLRHVPLAVVSLAQPNLLRRRQLWVDALAQEGLVADIEAIDAVANRFRLTPRRIVEAATAARISVRAPHGTRTAILTGQLLSAARRHAALDLGGLATPVTADYRWDDLVLPQHALRQLREFAEAIGNRDRIFRDWGFARGGACGLAALFAGGSGTGKTMSATVVARETGLDLWRIDLSTVVSKYIGETEKHLDRIFTTARDGNAILFFDEADALFGHRSEVKDAHDRYANIEVAFLLQRLEAHDGVSILATNLAKNVDPAFSRRMHAVIDFPPPDTALREGLWRRAFPPASPLAPDVDFAFLARQFSFAGGDIRTAALDAAFMAAAQDSLVTMSLVIQAVARQLLKQGKVPSPTEFREYYALLGGASKRSVA